MVQSPSAASSIKPGSVIAEKYRVEKELGRGGFGVVVRAVHLTLDEPVAIKILTEGDAGPEAFAEDAERFRREAQATAALKGEHIVRILDVDVLPTGFPYIVMEYLDGDTLHFVLHTKQLSVGEAVDVTIQMLSALGEAHAAGIVHRDLKPANVFLAKTRSGTPIAKVLDFGVSKQNMNPDAKTLTRTGAVIGTAAYMAPEQMLDAKRVDGRVDLWSAAVILYELLSRKNPFDDPNDATALTSSLSRAPTPLSFYRPSTPPPLDAFLVRCFERDPNRRFQNATEMAFALAELSTPRAARALDALRSTKAPRGAAAPGGLSRPQTLPPGGVRAQTAVQKGLPIIIPILALAIGLGLGIAGAVLYFRPHAKPPVAAPSASVVKPRAR